MSTEIHGQDSQVSEDFPTAPALQSFSPSQSPTPLKSAEKLGVDFSGSIIKYILDGRKVRRLSWPEGEIIFLKSYLLKEGSSELVDLLTVRKVDGTEHFLVVGRGDLNSDDWVVVE